METNEEKRSRDKYRADLMAIEGDISWYFPQKEGTLPIADSISIS